MNLRDWETADLQARREELEQQIRAELRAYEDRITPPLAEQSAIDRELFARIPESERKDGKVTLDTLCMGIVTG